MQELEKILEEIEQRIEKERKIITGHHHDEMANDIAETFAEAFIEAYEECQDIIRKYMNDGWISVEERLPMRTLDEKINESYQKYLVFIDGVDGWDIDIAVYNFWNDKKWREAHDGYGEIENVIAWHPLPEPYRPENKTEASDWREDMLRKFDRRE